MNYNINQLDCDRMAIHPGHPTVVKYFEKKIPLIKKIDSSLWVKGFPKREACRYILLMYDKNSPIQEMTSLDWFGKKFEACAYAGYELQKSKDGGYRFDEKVFDMVIGKIEEIADLIIAFLGFQNNHKWTRSVYLHETLMLYTKSAIMGKKQDASDRKEARLVYEEIEKVSRDMGHVYEDTQEFASRFYYQIEQSRLAIKPEDYARLLNAGDTLRGDNPYGVDYMVDKISFVGDHLPEDEQV